MIRDGFNAIAKSEGHNLSPYLLDIAARQCVGDYTPPYGHYEWHHVIPYSLADTPIFKENGALSEFHINDPKNCVALPDNADECAPGGAEVHNGRHVNAYRDGMNDLLNRWQTEYEAGKMTRAQVHAEFYTFLKAVRHNLDPSLNVIEGPLDPELNFRVMMYRDHPRLGTEDRFLKDLMVDPEVMAQRKDCSAEQLVRYEASFGQALKWIDIYKQRAQAIEMGLVKADDIIPSGPDLTEPIKALLADPDTPTISREYGEAVLLGAQAVTAAALAPEVIGLAAVARAGGLASVAVSEAGPSLTVIEGGAAAAAPVANVAMDYKIAAGAAGVALLSAQAAAAAPQRFTAETLLPPAAVLNAGADKMGDRSDVDHISWRFTNAPSGAAENSLSALYQRDMQKGMDQLGAHALLRADGSFERCDSLCRDWSSNPQAHAGYNSNGLGVYVEGKGELTEAQRQALTSLTTSLGEQRSGPASVVRLRPANADAEAAWSVQDPQPALGAALSLRPRVAVGLQAAAL